MCRLPHHTRWLVKTHRFDRINICFSGATARRLRRSSVLFFQDSHAFKDTAAHKNASSGTLGLVFALGGYCQGLMSEVRNLWKKVGSR